MMIGVDHAALSSGLAAFLASLVEFVEAATIVLAVGIVRGWRTALAGTGAGLLVLVVLVLVLGSLIADIPIELLQLAIGVLLLLFGLRWLRKAILRAAGIIAIHDEDAAFLAETRELRTEASGTVMGFDAVGFATAFKGVFLEGIEVVFIVIAVGAAGGNLVPAASGATIAAVIVVCVAVLIRHPLSRVPENVLKFGVGLMLSSFGVFWVGEGAGIEWPGADLSLFAIGAAFLAVSLALVVTARSVAGLAVEHRS
jgi:Ca2+/H+ antiporter, TMEM165/GDT1 family